MPITLLLPCVAHLSPESVFDYHRSFHFSMVPQILIIFLPPLSSFVFQFQSVDIVSGLIMSKVTNSD